jgi:hypothetical protein
MRVIPIPARAGITGFESHAAEYSQLGMSLAAFIYVAKDLELIQIDTQNFHIL